MLEERRGDRRDRRVDSSRGPKAAADAHQGLARAGHDRADVRKVDVNQAGLDDDVGLVTSGHVWATGWLQAGCRLAAGWLRAGCGPVAGWLHRAATSNAYGRSLECTGLQPLMRRVAASDALGCSVRCIGLPPALHRVAASGA